MITTKTLGRTGVKVPTIAFGTGGFPRRSGSSGPDADALAAMETVRAIFEGPAKFLDTSRFYAQGYAEELIGNVIRERGGLPTGFVIATKLDRDPESGRFDGDAARRSLETSLKTLGLDRFDILHLHDPEYIKDMTEVNGPNGSTAELFKMKEEGFADAIGLAAGDAKVMMPLLRDWDFDVMLSHNRFTLVNRNAEAMIDFSISRGMAVLNAAPYGGGIFAKGTATVHNYAYRPAPDAVLEPVRQVEAICARHGVPPAAVALQFSMRDPRITATVLGVSKPERVQETLELAEWEIPEAVWDELAAVPYATDDPQGFQ